MITCDTCGFIWCSNWQARKPVSCICNLVYGRTAASTVVYASQNCDSRSKRQVQVCAFGGTILRGYTESTVQNANRTATKHAPQSKVVCMCRQVGVCCSVYEDAGGNSYCVVLKSTFFACCRALVERAGLQSNALPLANVQTVYSLQLLYLLCAL